MIIPKDDKRLYRIVDVIGECPTCGGPLQALEQIMPKTSSKYAAGCKICCYEFVSGGGVIFFAKLGTLTNMVQKQMILRRLAEL